MTTNVKDSRKQVVMSSGVLDGWASFGLLCPVLGWIGWTPFLMTSLMSRHCDGVTSLTHHQTILRWRCCDVAMTSLCPNDVTNGVIEMTSLMTSSGPIEKLHGGTSQRSTFLNLEEAELLRVRCTVCLNSNRHLVIGPFQKSKFKPTVLPAGSLAPRQLAPG